MENSPLNSSRKAERQVWFHSPAKLIELGWSPLVTVLYVALSLANTRPLDYSVLAALLVLNITCLVYALKLHKTEEPPVEQRRDEGESSRPEPRVEQPSEQREPAKPEPSVEQPRGQLEPARPEPRMEQPRERREPAKPEPRIEQPGQRKEPSGAGALQKILDDTKGELEHYKRSSAALQSEIDEHTKRTAERLDVTSAMTYLKERARAIRRQWPDAAFCQRPLREQWWTPGANQSASVPWLGNAHEWHAHFSETRSRFFPSAPDDRYLRSLDLEEVIDFLDGIILSHDTRPLYRDTHVSPNTAPILVIERWGAPEGEDEKCGFWIRNTGEVIATNIQMARASIGSKVLSIYLPPSSALSKDERLFVIASLSGPPRVTAYHLEDLMRKLPANGINGAKPLGVAVKLVYDSNDDNRYASRHEMTMEDTGIKIGYVNTEVVSMPL